MQFLQSHAVLLQKLNDSVARDDAFRKRILGRYDVLLQNIDEVKHELEQHLFEVHDGHEVKFVKHAIPRLQIIMENSTSIHTRHKHASIVPSVSNFSKNLCTTQKEKPALLSYYSRNGKAGKDAKMISS